MPKLQDATPSKPNQPSYRERVLPSIASMLPLLLILPTAYLTLFRINPQAGLLVGISVTAAALVSIWFASPVIELDTTGFSVGDATLPIDVISGVRVISKAEGFAERGVNLDPSAFVRFQISVKEMVRLDVSDPQDSTPYWLVATRNPAEIVSTLQALKPNL